MQSRLPGAAPWRSVYDITFKAVGLKGRAFRAKFGKVQNSIKAPETQAARRSQTFNRGRVMQQ
jgi:hypothetical protein